MLLLVSPASASLLDDSAPVTLDQGEFSRIWQEVRSGVSPAPAAAADSWQQAMLAEDAELARVLLLAWLQEKNPGMSLAANAQAYADAVVLHRRALAGQPAACAALAAAYRAGALGALQLPPSEEKARWFEQRALSAGNLPR
ncbi:MAG: hypothetical protein IKA23_03295 [Akkermansia sp.]|nr:hypothetical protein [Akkermansia sp.]